MKLAFRHSCSTIYRVIRKSQWKQSVDWKLHFILQNQKLKT
jgi:hypothetical protein